MRIAALGGNVDAEGALFGKAQQIMRPAGFWPGAGKAGAAERLHADDGADNGAINVAIAGGHGGAHCFGEAFKPRVHPEREAVALRRKLRADTGDVSGVVADHVQDRAEHFLVDLIERGEFNERGAEENAAET